ncbi:MAG: PKD domain-containing protein, partial [Ekhidna sp.]|nr:PKD domain-containing protein [Ekhidna sp.]
GRVNSINIHPTNPDILYVGSAGGGLWKSETGGNSWTSLSEDFPILGVTDFYIAPENPEKMYVLTGDAYGADTYSYGVFKSTDGGENWSNDSNFSPSATDFRRMYRMIVDPNNSDVLLIAGTSGIWKSTDGANSWNLVNGNSFVDIEFKPGNTSIVYASSSNSTDVTISNDAGETWNTVDALPDGLGRTAIGVSPANPEYVYILASASNSSFGGVYLSTDSGETFEMQSNSPNIFGYSQTADDEGGQGWYDLAIAVNPEDAEDIYVSGIHIWNSKDGGKSWQDENGNYQILNYWVYNPSNTDNYVHADNHTLDFLNGELFAGCDGGIWKTSNLGQSWQDLSEGLNITQLYRLGLDPNNEDILVAGAQDNGSNIMVGEQWTHLFGADGMEALVDHTDSDIVYSTYQFGGLLKYSNGGLGEVEFIGGELDGTGAWVTPYMLDPKDNNYLYAGYQNVWKYNNSDGVWEEISNFQSTANLTSLKVAPTNSDYIYASTGSNTFRTKDAGANWVNISSGLPTESVSYISVSEDNPSKIWVTFSGYSSTNKVFESSDAGDSWTNISEGLPNLPVNCIVHQKLSDDQLYVGTDIGVYQKNNSGSWEPWFDGLPNIIVNELEIHYGSEKIVAATYGRGLWKTDILGGSSVIDISASELVVVEGNTTTFSAELRNGGNEYAWVFEGGTPSTSTDANPVISYAEAGLYDVSVNGATRSEMIKVLDFVEIQSIATDVQNIDIGQRTKFSATYEGEPTEWLWRFEGGSPNESSAQTPYITYLEEGEYDVSLVLAGDTEDEELFENFVLVIDALRIPADVNPVYPTVSSDRLFIKVESQKTTVELMTLSGESLLKEISDSDISLSIGNLAAGTYILSLTTEQSQKSIRIIKE